MTSYLIGVALQSRREKDVTEAIKSAKASGLMGRTVNNEVYVTEELKKVIYTISYYYYYHYYLKYSREGIRNSVSYRH